MLGKDAASSSLVPGSHLAYFLEPSAVSKDAGYLLRLNDPASTVPFAGPTSDKDNRISQRQS